MKIAYLTSLYPYVSHTFILREVRAIRERGIEIGAFSVRRSAQCDLLGDEAKAEAAATRWLVPPRLRSYLGALVGIGGTRPLLTLGTLMAAVAQRGLTMGGRVKWLAYFLEALQMAHWLVRERFDHLHCHFGNSGSSTAMLAARLARLPFSITCHGSELNEPERFRLADKVARARFIVCVSKYGKARLMMACSPEYWPKIHVVRCGIPPVSHSAEADSRGRQGMLCVARMSPEKGHLVLLDALAILRNEGLDAHCTLVGDGPMRATIERCAAALGLTGSIIFAGPLEPERVAALYRSAGLVVLASFSEGVPIVLMEAMAHSLPVVATRVGGVPELVDHGVTGLVVAPGDAQELAEALRQVLADPRRAADMGRNGAQVVRERFSIDVSAAQLEELFSASCPGRIS